MIQAFVIAAPVLAAIVVGWFLGTRDPRYGRTLKSMGYPTLEELGARGWTGRDFYMYIRFGVPLPEPRLPVNRRKGIRGKGSRP